MRSGEVIRPVKSGEEKHSVRSGGEICSVTSSESDTPVRSGAVIAAAGVPGGFRSYDKLEHTDRNAMLRRMIYTFRRAGVEDIAVLTGYMAEETEKSLAKLGVAFLRCSDYETGEMIDFAVRGFRYLKNCGRIFFCPADVPLFTEETLGHMLGEDVPVVIPVHEGRKGHPVLVDARLTEQIAGYKGDRGLKGAIDASGAEVCLLPVDDAGTVVRARREDHFEELASEERKPGIHPKVKLQLMRNTPFFGPGMMVLLKQIDVLGNVRDACEIAGMSYSKGWSLIRTAEAELGCPVVERSPGGRKGGVAQVSPAGRRLMEKYERLEKEVSRFAESRYKEIF